MSNAETVKCLLGFKSRKAFLLWQFKMFSALILATMTDAPKMPLERSRDPWKLLNFRFRKILRMWVIWSGIYDRIKGKPQPRFRSLCQVSPTYICHLCDTFLTWRYKSVKTTRHRSVVFCARACVWVSPAQREGHPPVYHSGCKLHDYIITSDFCYLSPSTSTLTLNLFFLSLFCLAFLPYLPV